MSFSEHEFGGIFIYVGVNPVTSMVADLGITDEAGWVITDERMMTPKAGIFLPLEMFAKELRQNRDSCWRRSYCWTRRYQYIENMT